MKDKSKSVESKAKRKIRFSSSILDALFLLVLVAALFLDLFLFKPLLGCGYDSLRIEASIITVLLPAIAAIVSVGVSIGKDKIYGASLNELNLLRGPFFFDIWHIGLCMCAIFGFYAWFYALDARIAIYVLMVISFAYSLIFVIQHTSLLIRSEGTIARLLKTQYRKQADRGGLKRAEGYKTKREERIYLTLAQGILFSEGIEAAVELLGDVDDEDKVLAHLLEVQNEYIGRYQAGLPSGYVPLPSPGDSPSVFEAIEKGYDNIYWLLKEGKSTGDYQLVFHSILYLHTLCKNTNMTGKEKEKMDGIVSLFLRSFNRESEVAQNIKPVFVALLAFTLQAGQTWFVELVRDGASSPKSLFSIEKHSPGLFINMMINFALRISYLGQPEQDELNGFLMCPCKGRNAHGETWQAMVEETLRKANASQLNELIPVYVKNVECVKKEDLEFPRDWNVNVGFEKHYFDKDVIESEISLLVSSKKQGN